MKTEQEHINQQTAYICTYSAGYRVDYQQNQIGGGINDANASIQAAFDRAMTDYSMWDDFGYILGGEGIIRGTRYGMSWRALAIMEFQYGGGKRPSFWAEVITRGYGGWSSFWGNPAPFYIYYPRP